MKRALLSCSSAALMGIACAAPRTAPVAVPSTPASAAPTTAQPAPQPTSAPAAAQRLTLTLVCRDIRKSATGMDLQAPLTLELRNSGGAEAVVDEIMGFNLDLPDRVAHRSDANASFTLRRVGAAVGDQRYSCAEGTPVEPEKVRIKPGGVYVHPVGYYAINSLAPGEYEARVTYGPLKLESAPCRFKVTP